MCRKKEKKDYRTELEKKAKVRYFEMSDGGKIRVLDFNLAKNPSEYIVLMIPGFLTVFQGWQKVLELLVKDHRVFYFESREKDSSILPKELIRNFTIHDMARDVKEVVEQLELDKTKYVVISSSTGGHILTEALSKQWLNPAGSIMIGPAIEFHIQWYVYLLSAITPYFLMKGLFKPLIKWWISIFYVNKKEEPEQLEKYIRALEEADLRKAIPLFRKLYRYDAWDLPSKVQTRTMLVGASKDKMHATEECKRVHELMPNSFYVDLGSNKATHSKPLVDEFKKFVKELESK